MIKGLSGCIDGVMQTQRHKSSSKKKGTDAKNGWIERNVFAWLLVCFLCKRVWKPSTLCHLVSLDRRATQQSWNDGLSKLEVIKALILLYSWSKLSVVSSIRRPCFCPLESWNRSCPRSPSSSFQTTDWINKLCFPEQSVKAIGWLLLSAKAAVTRSLMKGHHIRSNAVRMNVDW